MKWFKHYSDASHDEKLAEVLDVHGANAYGAYWLIVEAIAMQMDKSDKCEAKYSVKKWAAITHVDRRTLARYLQTFNILTLIVQQTCDKFVTIKIPKMLELRDNHTKNLQVTMPRDGKQEVEEEEDIKPVKKFSDEDMRFARWMFDLILQLDSGRKKPVFNNWADTVRLMRERDKLTHKEMAEVFKWANDDSFWSVNILSPTKLREKFSDLKLRKSKTIDEPHVPTTTERREQLARMQQ